MKCHGFFVLFLSFMSWAGGAPAQDWTEEWDETYYGIRHLHRYGTDAEGHFQNYHVVIVDLTDPHVLIRAALNNDTWGGGKETVRGMASRHGAAAAVNADYWNWGWNDPPQGTLAIDGYCYRAHPERSAVAFSADLSRIEIGQFGTWPIPDSPPDDCSAWVHNAVAAGPKFIYAGAVRWDERANASDASMVDINEDTWFGPEAWNWDTQPDPRTAVGISADGATLVLVTCDGRGAGGAYGCSSVGGLADTLLEFGAWEALKLDCGGSTTMYYDGDVVNVPSDGSERAVVDALLVISERRPPPECGTVAPDAETVIDDLDPCFVRSGAWWWEESEGWDGHMWYTYATDEPAEDCTGRWILNFEVPGTYAVDVYIPASNARSTRASYIIRHGGVEDAAPVDQAANAGSWIHLGEFDFDLPSDQYVKLPDNTGEALSLDIPLGYDALRLNPVSVPEPDPDGEPERLPDVPDSYDAADDVESPDLIPDLPEEPARDAAADLDDTEYGDAGSDHGAAGTEGGCSCAAAM